MSQGKGKKTRLKLGGLAFFFSYLASLPLALAGIITVSTILFMTDEPLLLVTGAGFILGWWFGYTLLRGEISVLIHEYKHAIFALFVGNKWKKLKLQGMSGAFHYAYTKDTAEYNAFISLAPYFLPVLTFIGLLFYPMIRHANEFSATLFLIAVHGAELYLQLKDATPIQTDLTDIRGGYWISLLYIIAMNICITSLLLLWILGGWDGLGLFGNELYQLGLLVVAIVRAMIIPG